MSRKFDWVDINFVKSNILKVIFEMMHASNANNFMQAMLIISESNQINCIAVNNNRNFDIDNMKYVYDYKV